MIDELVRATARSDWARARAILHTHWATAVPKVYAPSSTEPWVHSQDEKAIASELFVPLAAAYCCDASRKEPTLSPLNKEAGTNPDSRRPGQICGRVFRNGEPTYSCKECAQDPTCVLCHECFKASEHAKHKYRLEMSTSHGCGYCDCGDTEAWRQFPTCKLHANEQSKSSTVSVPEELQERLRGLTTMLLQYATTLLCWNHSTALPSTLIVPRAETSDQASTTVSPQFLTVLFNDETHTFDTVIRALELAIHCTTNQAMKLATIVDREGRSCVKAGAQDACERAKAEIQRRTVRDMSRRVDKPAPLEVRVMEASVVAHQHFAIALLGWLNAQTEQFPILGEVIGDVLLHVDEEPVEPVSTVPRTAPGSATTQGSVGDREKSGASSRSSSLEPGPPTASSPDSTMDEELSHDSSVASSHNQMDTVMSPTSSTSVPVQTTDSLLVKMIRTDRKLWKAVRSNFHQMLMKTVLMNFEQKEEFSRKFLELYEWIYSEFVKDDHEQDVSIVSLTVQFLTVTGVARRLVAHNDAIGVVSRALNNHCHEYLKKDEPDPRIAKFDFSTKPFPSSLKRALHMMNDMRYMLNVIPTTEEWTDELRDSFVSGTSDFIAFLHHLQGMDAVRKQSVEHQVWEQEWETAFNIQLRIQENISLILAWASTDKLVHHRLMVLVVEALKKHEITMEAEDETSQDRMTIVEVNGDSSRCLAFSIAKGLISIHLPLWRLFAGLFAVPSDFLIFLQPGIAPTIADAMEKRLRSEIYNFGQDIYELPLRTIVLCAQAAAQMWRRNGFSLVNQIHNYYSPLCRSEMFDRDLLMMQVGAALTKPVDFILHLLSRYRLVQWADLSFEGVSTVQQNSGSGQKVSISHSRGSWGSTTSNNGPPSANDLEDSSKNTVAVAEEFLQMLILIAGERYLPGVGRVSRMEQLQREVIHILCTGPMEYSKIERKIANEPLIERINLDEAVRTVADFKKAGSTSAGLFHLKESMREKYNPFFYHYSKADLSLAEQQQRKDRAKASRSVMACPPPQSPPFEPFFEPTRHLLRAPVVLRLVRVVLERILKRSRYASDRLLHRALYLVGMGLNEQMATPRGFDFIGAAEAEGILKLLEKLQGVTSGQTVASPTVKSAMEASAHGDLLWWTIQHYKKVEAEAKFGAGEKPVEAAVKPAEDAESGLSAKERQKALAAKKRALAMQQMSKKQSKFMEQIKKETEEGEESADGSNTVIASQETAMRVDDDEDAISKVLSMGFPVCVGTARSQIEGVLPRKVTCMLCQEEEVLGPDSKPFVMAAYVQKSFFFSQRPETTQRPNVGGAYFVSAGLECGVDASTCAHTMHAECYQQFADTVLSRDRSRARNQMLAQQRVLAVDAGEFMCPLCKRLSNTAMPLLPALQLLSTKGFSMNRAPEHEDFDDWVNRLQEALQAPPKSAKKGHSRKRSHSERSLLDLAKNADAAAREQAAVANGIGSSVATSETSLAATPSDYALNRLALNEPVPVVAAQQAQDLQAPPIQQPPELPPQPRRIIPLPPAPLDAIIQGIRGNEGAAAFPPDMRNAIAIMQAADPQQQQQRGFGRMENDVAGRFVDALLALVPGLEDGENPMNVPEQLERLENMADIMIQAMNPGLRDAEVVVIGEPEGQVEVPIEFIEREDEDQQPQEVPPAAEQPVAAQPADQARAGQAAVQPRLGVVTNAFMNNMLSTFKTFVKETKPKKRVIQPSLGKYEETVVAFTRFLATTTTKDNKEADSQQHRSLNAVVLWQSTAHLLRRLAAVLRLENKPLFGAFNTRQRDCLISMSRLAAAVAHSVQPFNELALRLLNVLLITPTNVPKETREGSQSPMPMDVSTVSGSSPPQATSTPVATSPPHHVGTEGFPPVSRRSNPLAFFQSPPTLGLVVHHKDPPVNLLHIDMLSVAVELTMAIGFTWNEGAPSLRGTKNEARELLADGSLDELYVLRLALLANLFQVLVTFEDKEAEDFEMVDADERKEHREADPTLDKRIVTLRKLVRGDEKTLGDVEGLRASLHAAVLDFLRPMALLYHAITLVPPPEALKDPFVDEFEPLCRYMGMPTRLADLLEGTTVEKLFRIWAAYIPQSANGLSTLVRQPVQPRQLIELPEDFSELINRAARFRCPTIPVAESTPAVPTMCLVCGKILCSQSYCCQRPRTGTKGTNSKDCVGACNWHMESCTGTTGLFLRVRDSQIFLMTSRSRGCFKNAPYVDEFGEVDPGFRRGNPLHLNRELYAKLKHLWLHGGIAEEVVNQYEIDQRNYTIDWDHF